ncbi:FIMAH domain-containing protein [Sorangium cellulosum]|uniref:FIMAH domain-containing protein n=1 Tax=Sorangium cellulosum TaxID=56 RepID=UPI0003F59EC9|nr:peptidoglycan DD-metalloendopeptidase family protein [Sorangium cellulosum]
MSTDKPNPITEDPTARGALTVESNALAAPTDCVTGEFGWPLATNPCSGFLHALTSDFGFRKPPQNSASSKPGTKYHFGLDFGAANGTPIYAVADGIVDYVNDCKCFTSYVAAYHPQWDITTLYYHMEMMKWSPREIELINSDLHTEHVRKGDLIAWVGTGHLDLRVVKGRLQRQRIRRPAGEPGPRIYKTVIPYNANAYIHPAKYYPSQRQGQMTVSRSDMKVRLGRSGGYQQADALWSHRDGIYIDLTGEDEVWVSALVRNENKDTADVKAFLRRSDGVETLLHHFNYFAGTSKVNETMELALGAEVDSFGLHSDLTGYVSLDGNPNSGHPSLDRFHVKVPQRWIPADGKTHQVIFAATDSGGSTVVATLPVRRAERYKVRVTPLKEVYDTPVPVFSVVALDHATELPVPIMNEERLQAEFSNGPAFIEQQWEGSLSYLAWPVYPVMDKGTYAMDVDVLNIKDGLVGSGNAPVVVERPPQPPDKIDRCGNRMEWHWDGYDWEWKLPFGPMPCYPDDNASSFISAGAQQGTGEGKVAVLSNGFNQSMATMLKQAGVAAEQVPLDFSPTMVDRFPVLFVPSGGLAGLAQSAQMKERFARYVEAGGTLIVFAQPRGADLALLPGGEVAGYGYDEDIYCVYRSAGIVTFGPQLMGQEEELVSFNLDGFFSRVPEGATVLLRRTISGMPAMFTYKYGQGHVLASSSYADQARAMGQGTAAEEALIRDLAVWGLNPDRSYPITSRDRPFDVPVTLQNSTTRDAASVEYELVGPEGASYGRQSTPLSLPAGGTADVLVPVLVPPELDDAATPTFPGVWRLSATLVDAQGKALVTLPNAGLFGVTVFEETPGGFRYQGEPYALLVTSESERYLSHERPVFTFHVFNHSEEEKTFDITWGLARPDAFMRSITVPAQSEGTITWQVGSGTQGMHRLRARILLGGRVVGCAERSVWQVPPEAVLRLVPTRLAYRKDETAALTLTITNRVGRAYDVTGTLTVKRGDGLEVANHPLSIHVPAHGPVSLEYTLPEALVYSKYTATAVLWSNGRLVAAGETAFDVPHPLMQTWVKLPVTLDQRTPITLHVKHHVGRNNSAPELRDVVWKIRLTDPADNVVWQSAGTIDLLQAGSEGMIALTLERPPLMFGSYWLTWEVALGGHAALWGGREHLLASLGAEIVAGYDQLTYRAGEAARLKATISNLGRWRIDPTVQIAFPAAGFTWQGKLDASLALHEHWTRFFEATLPADLPSGMHWPVMIVSPDPGWEEHDSSWPLTTTPSRLGVRVEAGLFQAGHPVAIRVSNTGGARTTASMTAQVIDADDHAVAEASAELPLDAAGEGSFAVLLPTGLVTGSYVVTVAGTDQTTGEPVALTYRMNVKGVEGTVTVRSSQDLYVSATPVVLQGEVQSLPGPIDRGSLSLAVYATEPGLEACAPAGSPAPVPVSPTTHWVGACNEVYNPWHWISDEQIYNRYLSAVMNGDGLFTLGIVQGDVTRTDDDGMLLLFGHPYPGNSLTTIRVDGHDYIFGQGGQWLEAPRYDPESKALTALWSNGLVRVRESITLEPAGGNPAMARIRYLVENDSADAHEVGLRVMLNAQNGYAYSAPFWLSGQDPITTETALSDDAVPDSFLSMRLGDPYQTVIQGIVRTGDERAPDRMILGNHEKVYRTTWDYTPDPIARALYDSAIVYTWSPVALAPGQTLDVSTRYGAGNITRATGELSTLIHLPTIISEPSQNPFPVRAFVRNNSTSTTASAVQVELTLPPGLSLEPGQDASQLLSSLAPRGEAQLTWLARATGEATGPLEIKVSTIAPNLSGSSVTRAVSVSARLFDPTASDPVWQRTLPLTTDAIQSYTEPVRPLLPGKYYATATLRTATGQTLAGDQYPFLVSQDQTLLALQADKPAYRPGETVTITGAVTNLSSAEAAYTLNVATAAGTLLAESFTLAPGQSRPCTASLMAESAGSITFEATAGLARLVESVFVASPQVESRVVAPAVVGREPFDIQITLTNTGIVPATVQAGVAGEVRTFDLAPGERIADARTIAITADAQIPVTFSGDLSRDEVLTVRQGELAQLTLMPATRYLEGPVSVAYRLANTGELTATFPLQLALDGEQVERSYTLLPGETLMDSLSFTARAGDLPLSWQTPYGTGQVSVYVHRPVVDKLTMETAFPAGLTADDVIAVELRNEGENPLEGQVLITTPWSTRSLPFDLAPGEQVSLQGRIDTAFATGPGSYPVTAEAIVHGATLAHADGPLTVVGPRMALTPETPAETAPGAEATFTVQVSNTGDMNSDATVVLDLPGIERQEVLLRVAPGQSLPVSFTVHMSPDLPSGTNRGMFRVGAETTEFIYTVRGYEGTASARLDSPFYKAGQTPVLHVDTTTHVPHADADEILLRVSGEDLDLSLPVPSGAGSFDIPLPVADRDRLVSYGLYLESGRSLYLSTVQIRIAAGAVTLYTDRPTYRPGETVTALVTATEAGQLTVNAPGHSVEQVIAAGELTLTFTLPAVMPRGVHDIRYALNGEEHLQAITVNAPGVVVHETVLTKADFAGGLAVNATLTIEATDPMAGAVAEWWATDLAGNKSCSRTRTVDLPAGRSTLALEGLTCASVNPGSYMLTFEIRWNGITVNRGAEMFDVAGPCLLGLTPGKGSHRLGETVVLSTAVLGEGEAELSLLVGDVTYRREHLTLSGYQALALPVTGLSAGTHRAIAVLEGARFRSRVSAWVRVLPLPTISIFVRGTSVPEIALVASEPDVQIHYRWNDGADQIYSGSVTAPPSGASATLHAFAVVDGLSGPVTSRLVAWDTVPPEIRINHPQAGDYLHSDRLIPQISITDDGAGVSAAATRLMLDGTPIDPSQSVVDLFFLRLGAHLLTVAAEDNLGNRSAAEVQFRVIATVASTISDLHRAGKLGWIRPAWLVHSLEAMLEAAQKALNRRMPQQAINHLRAFVHLVEAERGKHMTDEAAAVLLADAEWVIAALR